MINKEEYPGTPEKKEVETIIEQKINKNHAAGRGILELLTENATDRLINPIKSFLEFETSYQKMPFTSVDDITVTFFVEKYSIKQLKSVLNLGNRGLMLLNRILRNAGYDLLRES
ncbi:hypothetical protein OQX61_23770 [Pedobacter sp. PLR]|uniref:hypothetical protein n=1 Tax=Pedobacter sp. PLR TaxID=2994465 RepID=UPI0022458BEC|nr:hypothetical protein [Pedobacter sp. PLR]MCX2454309.1 hypothetical protein [Pedobacter sp. PLR]